MTLLYGPDGKPLIPDPAPKSKDKATGNTPEKNSIGKRANRLLWGAILSIATLIGAAAVGLPRPSVSQSDPVDPNNSMSASFTVTNNNYIPLWHVTVLFSPGLLTTIAAHDPPPNFDSFVPNYGTQSPGGTGKTIR